MNCFAFFQVTRKKKERQSYLETEALYDFLVSGKQGPLTSSGWQCGCPPPLGGRSLAFPLISRYLPHTNASQQDVMGLRMFPSISCPRILNTRDRLNDSSCTLLPGSEEMFAHCLVRSGIAWLLPITPLRGPHSGPCHPTPTAVHAVKTVAGGRGYIPGILLCILPTISRLGGLPAAPAQRCPTHLTLPTSGSYSLMKKIKVVV